MHITDCQLNLHITVALTSFISKADLSGCEWKRFFRYWVIAQCRVIAHCMAIATN